jgi:hypothetical protein
MKIGRCLMAGIFGVAAVAGIIEALVSPRTKEEQREEEKKKEERESEVS